LSVALTWHVVGSSTHRHGEPPRPRNLDGTCVCGRRATAEKRDTLNMLRVQFCGSNFALQVCSTSALQHAGMAR